MFHIADDVDRLLLVLAAERFDDIRYQLAFLGKTLARLVRNTVFVAFIL